MLASTTVIKLVSPTIASVTDVTVNCGPFNSFDN